MSYSHITGTLSIYIDYQYDFHHHHHQQYSHNHHHYRHHYHHHRYCSIYRWIPITYCSKLWNLIDDDNDNYHLFLFTMKIDVM